MGSTSILVVDDDAAFRAAVSRLLGSAGYRVAEAQGGGRAQTVLQSARPDILVTDIIMPDGDGIELINAVKWRYPTIRILAVSGRGCLGTLDLLKMAAMVGADATLSKPLGPEDLLSKVAGLVAMGPGSYPT
ncbi:response regulator [Caulobacter sp. NIBR1757]|uniref:response regulator n=1 Tax=Caulobacter sp. NIBR1757 TaxID=3016000 RepID=UPI0022F01003|nr:response regulator [Caulobacter sp. NIBR1757]WGM41090.1 Response regulator MprA [Caulobacter sp. NIBR1757]